METSSENTDDEQTSLFEVSDEDTQNSSTQAAECDPSPAGAHHCTHCGVHVDPASDDCYSEVLTWLRGRNKDSSTLREYTGRFACRVCVLKIRAGMSPTAKNLDELLDAAREVQSAGGPIITDESPIYRRGFNDGYSGRILMVTNGNPLYNEYVAGYQAGAAKLKDEAWG